MDALKPDILRTLDLSRMEKKSMANTPEQATVTDVEQSIGTIEPLPSPQHLEVRQRDKNPLIEVEAKNLQVQLPFTGYAYENKEKGAKHSQSLSNDFKMEFKNKWI